MSYKCSIEISMNIRSIIIASPARKNYIQLMRYYKFWKSWKVKTSVFLKWVGIIWKPSSSVCLILRINHACLADLYHFSGLSRTLKMTLELGLNFHMSTARAEAGKSTVASMISYFLFLKNRLRKLSIVIIQKLWHSLSYKDAFYIQSKFSAVFRVQLNLKKNQTAINWIYIFGGFTEVNHKLKFLLSYFVIDIFESF